MAAIAVIAGGTFGFISALAALMIFDAGILLALGLWAFGGIAIALFLLLVALLPKRQRAPILVTEHA